MNRNQVAFRARICLVVLSCATFLLCSFYAGFTYDRLITQRTAKLPQDKPSLALPTPDPPQAELGFPQVTLDVSETPLDLLRVVPELPRTLTTDLVSQLMDSSEMESPITSDVPWEANSFRAQEVGCALDLPKSNPLARNALPEPTTAPVGEVENESMSGGLGLPLTQTLPADDTPKVVNLVPPNTDGNFVLANQTGQFSPLQSRDYGIGSESETLVLSSGEVRDLHLADSGPIQPKIIRIQVADPNICEAVISSPTKIQIIALGGGQTQVDAWVSLRMGEEDPTLRKYRIQVMSFSEQLQKKFGDRLGVLHRSLRRIYPNSSVSIRVESSSLVVSGTSDTSENARAILRMIRKVVLVPVKDELIAEGGASMVPMRAPFSSGVPYEFDQPCECKEGLGVSAEHPLQADGYFQSPGP